MNYHNLEHRKVWILLKNFVYKAISVLTSTAKSYPIVVVSSGLVLSSAVVGTIVHQHNTSRSETALESSGDEASQALETEFTEKRGPSSEQIRQQKTWKTSETESFDEAIGNSRNSLRQR